MSELHFESMLNKIIYTLLKKVYRKLRHFTFVRNLRLRYISYKDKKGKKRLERYRAKIEKIYKDADFSRISVKNVSSSKVHRNCVFKFDVLGQITQFKNVNLDACTNGLLKVIEQNDRDVDVHIGIVSKEQKKNNPEMVTKLEQQLSAHFLSPGEAILVSRRGFKAMFFAFDYDGENDSDEAALSKQDTIMLAYAKEEKVNYLVAYGLRNDDSKLQLSKSEEAYERLLANLGCSYVFSSTNKGLYKGGNIRKMDGGFTNIFASTGEIFGTVKPQEPGSDTAGVILRTRISKFRLNKFVSCTGYIPYQIRKNGQKIIGIDLIHHRSDSVKRQKKMMESLTYIEHSVGNIKENRNIFTVKELCKMIGATIPKDYQYLSDICVGKVCSRSFEVEPWDVFFFLPQFRDKNDGEPKPWRVRKRIVEAAVERGVMFIVSYRPLDPSIPHVVVKNSREAHVKVCAELRKKYNTNIIGITGSVGKTSTKDMMYEVLRQKYTTYRNLRNSNVQVHIGLHVQEFCGEQEFFIQEIGGGRPGGASRHSRMVLPDACVITNIGSAHIGNYGRQENTLIGKLGVVEGMSSGGTLYVNWDDPLLARVDKKRLSTISNAQDDLDRSLYKIIRNVNVVSYGVHNHNADYYADDIVEKDGVTEFKIVDGKKKVKAALNVRGEYNVLNAVCCYAIGKKYNISDRKIIEGLSNFRTSGVRQNLISVGGYKLFVDCFNSSPPSVESSLSVLDLIETQGKKVAIIGDITGADELIEEVHRQVGEIVNNHRPDVVVCYGESSKIVYDKIKDNFKQVYHFTQTSKLNEFLQTKINVGDVVLFKGSSKMLLSERVDENYGTMLSDQGYIDTVKYKEYKQSGITYYMFKSYATAVKGYFRTGQTVKIPKHILGLPVYNLGDEAFCGMEELVNVIIPEGVRHIGQSCFEDCKELKNLSVPKSLKYIAPSAFRKCENLNKVALNEGLIHIGERAFRQCKNLEKIEIPGSVTEIGNDAFTGCKELKVYGKRGSYVEEYCMTNGIDFVSK